MSRRTVTKSPRIEVQGKSDIIHQQRPVYKFFQSTPPRRSKPVDSSMIGLLTLAAVPTTIAICEGVSKRETKPRPGDTLKEARHLRKFGIHCYCAGSSAGKRDVHEGKLVVGDGKVYVKSPRSKSALRRPLIEAESFYVEYPDPKRTPAILGLVTKVRTDPPLGNWIYIDRDTRQMLHSNRSGSINHWIGDFGATDGFEEPDEKLGEDEPTGITFEDNERFVVVQPLKGSTEEEEGLWQIWWDGDDNKLHNGKHVDGRLVLRVSLERHFIEEEGA